MNVLSNSAIVSVDSFDATSGTDCGCDSLDEARPLSAEEKPVRDNHSEQHLSPKKNDSVSVLGAVSVAAAVLDIEQQLSDKLSRLSFSPPVAYVYNPLHYAWATHCLYVSKYCCTKKKILFVGMNPGPWGMVQTGVYNT